jgi:hypothetical protein
VLRIFIALKNPSPWSGFESATFGSSGQHTNHYTTKATRNKFAAAFGELSLLYIYIYIYIYLHTHTHTHTLSLSKRLQWIKLLGFCHSAGTFRFVVTSNCPFTFFLNVTQSLFFGLKDVTDFEILHGTDESHRLKKLA